MGLIDAVGEGPVAIDTVAFIYWIEEHPPYLPVLAPLFEAIDAGRVQAVTSGVTLLEVLVVPYRAGDIALAERYEQILAHSRGLRLVDLGLPLLHAAAQLRAVHRMLRIPDALQVATALGAGVTAFVTNDSRLPAIPGLAVVALDEHLRSR